MGNKNDLYINYKRFNKKHKHNHNNKLWMILLGILLVAGLGYGAFFYVRPVLFPSQPNTADIQPDTDSTDIGSTDLVTPIIQASAISPTIAPTREPDIKPTDIPTVSPAKEVSGTEVQDNNTDVTGKVPYAVKGLYVPARSAGSDKIDKLIDIANDTEINAMVIDIKDDYGRISYAMDYNMVKEIGSDTNIISDMPGLIQKLKEKNIYLIARIVAFKDPYLAGKCPELAIKNKDGTTYVDGNGQAWVNPYNKKVWDYLVNVASQAVSVGFDEIQFDYIRFSTSKEIEQADFGEEANGTSKEEVITAFTKYAYQKLKPLGVSVSADVYGTIIASSIDAARVGQNYVDMSKYLDYICPMIYPSHFGEGNFGIKYPDTEPFQIISKILAKSAEKLNELPEDEHHAIVRPWLQDFTATWIDHHIKYGGDEIREQIEGVYSTGYQEWLLWNAGSNYSKDGLLEE